MFGKGRLQQYYKALLSPLRYPRSPTDRYFMDVDVLLPFGSRDLECLPGHSFALHITSGKSGSPSLLLSPNPCVARRSFVHSSPRRIQWWCARWVIAQALVRGHRFTTTRCASCPTRATWSRLPGPPAARTAFSSTCLPSHPQTPPPETLLYPRLSHSCLFLRTSHPLPWISASWLLLCLRSALLSS